MNNGILYQHTKKELEKINDFLNHPFEAQKKVLKEILKENENTYIGNIYSFSSINTISDYQSAMPFNTYSDIFKYLNENDIKDKILSDEPIIYWARTSGSSGNSKLIPHTKSSLENWNIGALRILYSYLNETKDTNFNIDHSRIIPSVGPSFTKYVNNIPVGCISGIMASRNPVVSTLNPIPDSVMNITDFDKKLLETAKSILKEDVFAMIGISTFSINLLHYIKYELASKLKNDTIYKDIINKVSDENDVIDINKLWPNFHLFLSTGVLLEQVKEKTKNLANDLWIGDFYSGTEGAYAFTRNSKDPGLTLNLDLYFFEFKDIDTNEVHTIETVQLHKKYELILTSINGLYRYLNGDIVEFVSLNPFQIKVLGRTSTIINLIGEKLNESEISQSVNDSLKNMNLHSNEFMFFGWIDKKCFAHHCLAIELDKKAASLSLDNFSEILKKNISKRKIAYKNGLNSIIKKPHIILLKPGTIKDLQVKKASEAGFVGHTKVKKIINFNEAISLLKNDYILENNLPQDVEKKFNINESEGLI